MIITEVNSNNCCYLTNHFHIDYEFDTQSFDIQT